jgi:hypothetical protein
MMRIKRGLVGGWVCGIALFGAWVGCSPRTEIGLGPGGGSGGKGSTLPQAGSGGGTAPEAEAGSPGNGSPGGAGTSGGTDAGGTTSGGTDAGGTTSGGTDAGGTASGGTDAGGTASGGTDAGGTAGTAGTAGSPPDLTIVRPTLGCGMAAPSDLVAQQFVQRTMETSGHKENSSAPAACRPGGQATYDWNIAREYFVRLPDGYNPEKAYPLVLQAEGCGRFVGDLVPLSQIAEQVIRVGFSPATADCCFDIFDGDNSIEFPFYEKVWQRLAGELCFDQNRVFAAGAGQLTSIWANQLGCVYAGHAEYPIRAIGGVEGGLLPLGFTQPTCSQSPMAGMWLHNAAQFEYQDSIIAGIDTAMQVNGCPGRSQYTAERTPYEVPGLSAPESVRCGRITSAYYCAEPVYGCPNHPDPVSCSASHPMVMCSWGDDDLPPYPDVIGGANLAFAHFFSSFFAP